MTTTTATIRVEGRLLERAKQYHINVSEAARKGIERAIRERRVKEQVAWLDAHVVRVAGRSSTTALRSIRDNE